MTRDDAEAWAEDTDIALVFYDGFDDAILGIGQRFTSYFVVYDLARVLRTLQDRDGMSEEDAREFVDFNVVGGWIGEGTACFLMTDEYGR